MSINFAAIGTKPGHDPIIWASDFSEIRNADDEKSELKQLIEADVERQWSWHLQAVEDDRSRDFLKVYQDNRSSNKDVLASLLTLLHLHQEYEMDAVRAAVGLHALLTRPGANSVTVRRYMDVAYDDSDRQPSVYSGDDGLENAAEAYLGEGRVEKLNARGALKAAMMNMPFVSVFNYNNEMLTVIESSECPPMATFQQ